MSANQSTDGKTLAMTVNNTGFLLDRMGRDCRPLQFLRELTKNSIEAILRAPSKRNDIIWDVDGIMQTFEGRFKLCITDNGDGMTAKEMVTYINQLSSSGAKQSLSGNYGVGAKIAAASQNHYGVIYQSWKNGTGSMIHFWRDPVTGTYGLRQFETSSGDYSYSIELEDCLRPESIKTTGTKVILLGNTEMQNTMEPPTPDTPSPSRWISKYLNTRYFRIPDNITIRAREGWQHSLTDSRNRLRTIIGQESYLNDHKLTAGNVKLTDAIAHWWILRDEPAIQDNSGFIESAGHVAALYQDELYELKNGRAGTSRLQNFGVVFGYRFVVIYIEPNVSLEERLTTDTARTMLLLDNEELPWAYWAVEFCENMPAEIAKLITEKSGTQSDTDHAKTIRERLTPLIDLYKIPRYRPKMDGSLEIDDRTPTRGGQSKKPAEQRPTGRGGSPGGEGGAAGGIYSIFEKPNGQPGELVEPNLYPKVEWISTQNNTREPGDLEDRAARFLVNQNLLLINADFRVFTATVSMILKEYGETTMLKHVVEREVRLLFELALVETVIGIQALKGSKEWTLQEFEKALSEEALTTAVMSRYHIYHSTKRELGSKLSKMAIMAEA
jgi:hypothetical protein